MMRPVSEGLVAYVAPSDKHGSGSSAWGFCTEHLNLDYGSENIGFMDCYFNPNMSVGSHTGTGIFDDGRM